MARAKRLAKHIERTVTGPMWHGPALLEVLEGVSAAQALARPASGAHSIWELVHHITAWCDIARLRIKGQATGDPTPEQDWPPVPVPASAVSATSELTSDLTSDLTSELTSDPTSDPEAEWRKAIERMTDSHRRLAADARLIDDEQLDALVPGLDYAVSVLLHGIIEHGTYHGGQIALLRKAR